MIDYLNRIIRLCRDRHISVVLFNAPVHREYRDRIPAKVIESFDRTKSELLNKYSNVRFVDYSDFALPDDYYSDCDHVNWRGDDLVSRSLNTLLAPRYL